VISVKGNIEMRIRLFARCGQGVAAKSGADVVKRIYQKLLVRAAIAVLLLANVSISAASAQVSKGSVSGSVTDAQGAAIDGASVIASSKDSNQNFSTTSDNAGLFRLSQLPPGVYRLEITKTGFRKLVFDNVDVGVGADRGIGAVKMEIGEITSAIEVTTALPLLQTTEAQISNSFTSSTLQTFAGILENQGLDNLALTVPGVVNNRDLGFSNTNGTGFAVNGLRGRNNDQQIDGQNNNDNSVGGPGLPLSDAEFVQEYQITTSNFGAEYGRNSGSVVNVITKSGTNVVHGSVYGTESNSVLNALSNTQKAFEGLTKPARFNDTFVGGTIGGPLWRDHVFFFGGLDSQIVSQREVFATGLSTPNIAGIATLDACYPGSASVAALKAHGPYAVGGGNPTPQGDVQIASLTDCSDGVARDLELQGVQRTLPTGSKSYNFPIKLDIQTAKNHFYGRYLYNRSTFFNADSFVAGGAASGYPNNVPALAQDYAFSWARTLTSRMSNEFRATYGRVNVEFGGNSIGNTVPNQGAIDNGLTRIVFSDPSLLPFGPATIAPQGRIVNTYQLQDNWNYFRGRHSLKAGVNFTYQRSPNKFLPSVNGEYRFGAWGPTTTPTSTDPGYGANVPNRIRIASGDPTLDFREKDTFIYFGDDFKVKHNLTLNLGVTWSYYGQPANLFHDKTTKNQTGSDHLWDPALPLSVTTFPSIPAPKNSWGPNVGFAWTPGFVNRLTGNGKTVVRGGYRLAYDPAFYNIYLNISSAAPNVLLNTLTGASATGNPLPADPLGPAVRAELQPFLLTGIFDPRRFNETSITPDFGPQKVHSWSLGVQRDLGGSAVVEVRYVGNHGTRLFQSVNGNPYIAGLAAEFPSLLPSGLTPCSAADAQVTAAVGREHCDLGVVRTRTNSGYSDYNGLQTEFRSTEMWHQLVLKTGYTFSKTTDNASEIFSSGAAGASTAFAQSQVNFTGQEHGLSGLDFRHNWTVSFYEQIPAFRSQQGLLGHILGGWSVSGSYFISSGQPYTPIQGALSCFSNGLSCGGTSSSNPYDGPFNNAFVGADGALRPFLGNSAAPLSSVGIFGADACSNFGATGSEPFCDPALANSLLSLNAINASGTATVVTSKDVRFIANTDQSVALFGTPFGNVGRNTLRDAWSNIGNFSLSKTVKVRENFKVVWHMTMLNVFNHPNFRTVDPALDDAGLTEEGTGFGVPSLTTGGIVSAVGFPGRSIRFGFTLRW